MRSINWLASHCFIKTSTQTNKKSKYKFMLVASFITLSIYCFHNGNIIKTKTQQKSICVSFKNYNKYRLSLRSFLKGLNIKRGNEYVCVRKQFKGMERKVFFSHYLYFNYLNYLNYFHFTCIS